MPFTQRGTHCDVLFFLIKFFSPASSVAEWLYNGTVAAGIKGPLDVKTDTSYCDLTAFSTFGNIFAATAQPLMPMLLCLDLKRAPLLLR